MMRFKTKLVKSSMYGEVMALAARADHKTLAVWASDCVQRVLPYFEKKYPLDPRPRQALEALQAWIETGVFRMADVRRASLAAHAAARAVAGDDAAHSAARAAGQAMATAHVPGHAIGAAIYAATAVRDASNLAEADATA